MLSKFFCLVFVLFDSLLAGAQGQCRNLRFTTDPIHGYRLKNHVIRTLDIINEDICRLQCYLEPNCVSYNFKKKAEANGQHKCDLNNATYEHGSKHAKNKNYVYRGAENACARKPCKNNATCQAGFTDRDYQCLCARGFTGYDCRHDVDECTDGSHSCDVNAVCNNIRGSYNCTCKDGFHGDGINCSDVDECTDGSHSCDVNAVCNNIRGSYNCTCKDGFHGDGINCNVPDPIALYPLDGAHGTKEINNRVGAGVASAGVHTAPGPDGNPDGSYEFSGTANSYIEFPNGGGLDVKNSITTLCWLYPGGQDGPLFNYRKRGRWGVHLWVLYDQLFVRFNKRDYSLTQRLVNTHLKPEDGWKFVGASYDQANGDAKLWVDGKVVQTLNIGANLQLGTQDSVRMGVKIGDGRYFKGRIAQMQVYNVALTQEQIQAIKERIYVNGTNAVV